MTDKPIMIDGVDVSGCKKLDREYAPNYPEIGGYDWFNECKETSTYCEGRNCLFKQLARKTHECEELKNKLKYIRGENIHLKESATDEQIDFLALNNYIKTLELQIDQLKAENDQLKKIIERLDVPKHEVIDMDIALENEKLKAENEEYKKNGVDLFEQLSNGLKANEKLKAQNEQAEQKLEKIRQICNCSKSQMNCEQCPMCDECEELCVNDENLQDIILQIIDEVK